MLEIALKIITTILLLMFLYTLNKFAWSINSNLKKYDEPKKNNG